MRQTAVHEELSIDMSSSSSPPRLGVRFLPTIPSAADSSIILDDADSGNDNGLELSQNESSVSEGLIIITSHCDDDGGKGEAHGSTELGAAGGLRGAEAGQMGCRQEIVVNVIEEQEDTDDGLEMRLGKETAEKRASGSSSNDSFQPFYTVLLANGGVGSARATLGSSKDGERPP